MAWLTAIATVLQRLAAGGATAVGLCSDLAAASAQTLGQLRTAASLLQLAADIAGGGNKRPRLQLKLRSAMANEGGRQVGKPVVTTGKEHGWIGGTAT